MHETLDPEGPHSLDRIDPADPFPTYRALQAADPVHWSASRNAWVITRYGDVAQCLRSDSTSAERAGGTFRGFSEAQLREVSGLQNLYRTWPLFSDPPRHTRTRQLASAALRGAFTIERQRIIRDHVDAAAAALVRTPVPCDVVPQYAAKVAADAMAALFGLPADQLARITTLAKPIVDYIGLATPDFGLASVAQQALTELTNRVRTPMEAGRVSERSDVIAQVSRLAIQYGCDDDEARGICINLLVDGHEPTTAAISIGILELVAGRITTGDAAAGAATEEVLRLATPFQYIVRTTLVPLVITGKEIPAGSRLMLMIGAANRDADVFDECPRKEPPASHLAFGAGAHRCPAASLARFVLSEALRSFSAHLPSATLSDPSAVEWRQSLGYRNPVRIDLTW